MKQKAVHIHNYSFKITLANNKAESACSSESALSVCMVASYILANFVEAGPLCVGYLSSCELLGFQNHF